MSYKAQLELVKKPVMNLSEVTLVEWTSGSYFNFTTGSGNLSGYTFSASSSSLTFQPGRYMFEAYGAVIGGVGSSTVAEYTWELDGTDVGIKGRFNDYVDFSDRDIALFNYESNTSFSMKLKVTNDTNSQNLTSSNSHIIIWGQNEL